MLMSLLYLLHFFFFLAWELKACSNFSNIQIYFKKNYRLIFSIHPPIHLSIHPLTPLFMHLSIYLSVHACILPPLVHPSIPPTHPPIHPSTDALIHLPIHPFTEQIFEPPNSVLELCKAINSYQ